MKGYQKCDCGFDIPGPRSLVCPSCKGPSPRAKKAGLRVQIENEDGRPILIESRRVFSYPDGYAIDNPNLQHVGTPAGLPPIRLKPAEGEDFPGDDTLREWAGDVRQSMINKGQYLTNKALAYWARHELNRDGRYAPGGDEMQYTAMVINSMPDITTREVEG